MSHGYASGYVDGRRVFLHHFVFQKPAQGKIIDHINNDRLDNRKTNLREATRAENSHNVPKRQCLSLTSRFKGVSWDAHSKKFCAKYANRHLGLFTDEISAAGAYDAYSKHIHGDLAANNDLGTPLPSIESFEKTKQGGLPKGIYRNGQKYYALSKYKKKIYKRPLRENLEKAISDLRDIRLQIQWQKIMEQLLTLFVDIPRNSDGVAIITCKDGSQVLVDDNDWRSVHVHSWFLDNGYVHNAKKGRLHRFLMNPAPDEIIDHINQNKLDNRRSNLRIVSYSVNNNNRPKQSGCTSRYKGVYFDASRGLWGARIQKNHHVSFLGRFKTEDEARHEYLKHEAVMYPKMSLP